LGGSQWKSSADSGLLEGVIDVSTTEIADEIAGGTLSAGPNRLDVFARHALPWVGSCGALDMANFGAWETVPERFRGRRLYRHNPTVTLMRTTADECRAIGEFLVTKLNAMRGPMRFLIPEGGVSAIDRLKSSASMMSMPLLGSGRSPRGSRGRASPTTSRNRGRSSRLLNKLQRFGRDHPGQGLEQGLFGNGRR